MLYLVGSGTYRVSMQTFRQIGNSNRAANAPAEECAVTRTLRHYDLYDNFGGCELLCNDTQGVRLTSVVTQEPGFVWGIPRRIVEQKLRIPPLLKIPNLLSFCSGVKLFSNMSPERLQQLCRGAESADLSPGERVIRAGDSARSLFAVVAGSVVTSHPSSDFSLTIRPPETFGEPALAAADEVRAQTLPIRPHHVQSRPTLFLHLGRCAPAPHTCMRGRKGQL